MNDPLAADLWDSKETLRNNYASLGVVANVNSKESVSESKSRSMIESQEISEEGQRLLEVYEQLSSQPAVQYKAMMQGERDFCAQCISKYDMDFEKMARDRKLNVMQHTANQIEKKITLYKNFLARDQALLAKKH